MKLDKKTIKILDQAEAIGYILRADGSQIVSSAASVADAIHHSSLRNEANCQQAYLEGMREMAAALIREDENNVYSDGEGNPYICDEEIGRNNLRAEQRKIRDQLLSKGD